MTPTNLSFENINACLSSSHNAVYPIKSRYFILHTSSHWFTSHMVTVKRPLRTFEHIIRLSPFHKSKLLMARKVYIYTTRIIYINSN